jgi:SPP1 family predicted phage head-tail adaptor
MSAGKLTKRVTIQQRAAGSPAKDAFGAPVTSWTTFAEVWASLEPVSGREFWAQQQVQSEVTIKVNIRYLAGVLPEMRILYGTRVLTIKHVIDPMERHDFLNLMCAEGVKDE